MSSTYGIGAWETCFDILNMVAAVVNVFICFVACRPFSDLFLDSSPVASIVVASVFATLLAAGFAPMM